MKFSRIFVPTSRRTAGLGGSRQPSLTWTAFRTTSSPRASISGSPRAPLPTGTFLVCLLWRSTSPLPLIHRFLNRIMSPSPPLDMGGGLGGPSAPLPRRLSRLPWSLCAVRIRWGGVLNLTPSLKDTSPHALAGPGLLLRMGGALTIVAVSPLPPSRPLSVLGGINPGMLPFLLRPHPHRTPPPILRFSGGGDLIPLTPSKVQARILRSGGAARLSPLRQFPTFYLPLGASLSPPPCLW
jgi:hypothetical protein